MQEAAREAVKAAEEELRQMMAAEEAAKEAAGEATAQGRGSGRLQQRRGDADGATQMEEMADDEEDSPKLKPVPVADNKVASAAAASQRRMRGVWMHSCSQPLLTVSDLSYTN